MLSLVVTKSLLSLLLPPPPATYPLPWLYHGSTMALQWLYHGSTMALIDSVIATMVIVTGPHLLRARMTSRPSTNRCIACSATFLHHLLRRSEVSRTFEKTSTQELLFSSSIKLNSNNLAVQNVSQVYMSHILNWRLEMLMYCEPEMLVYYAGILSAFSHHTNWT